NPTYGKLKEHRLQDGIMRKACRNRPLSEVQTKRNRYLSKTRYVVEQSFGTLHRKFRYARAAYFGLIKVSAQSHLKAMCLNLLKAANRLSAPAAAQKATGCLIIGYPGRIKGVFG
ncbi:transposase, partial [Neisseria meningitidis]